MHVDTTRVGRSPILSNLICMAAMVIWAAGLPAAEPLFEILPAMQLTAARMSLAATALVAIWFSVEGPGALRSAPWSRGLTIGGLLMGAAATFLIYGQSLSDPVTVAIVSASMPIVGITLEVLLDRRRLTLAILAGLVLSIVGGLIALDLNGAASGFGLGAVFCLISIALFAIGSRLTVTALPELTALGSTALTVAGAGLATVLVALAQEMSGFGHADWEALSTTNWMQLCFFAVFSMALTQVLWIMSVGRLGIATSALHHNAAPFYVMLILFALGAPWNWQQALGALVVGLGVMVAQNLIWQRRPRRADA